jgi:hypothetical protein
MTETQFSNFPEAPVIQVTYMHYRNGSCARILTVRCPYCKRTHTHGGGPDSKPLELYLGTRRPHCPEDVAGDLPDYCLVMKGQPEVVHEYASPAPGWRRPPPLRESDMLESLREAAKLGGWAFYHTWFSKRSGRGFPDLVLVHPSRGIIFAELKTARGRVRPEQAAWLDALRAAASSNRAVWVCLWRPEHLIAAAEFLLGQRSAPPGIWPIAEDTR